MDCAQFAGVELLTVHAAVSSLLSVEPVSSRTPVEQVSVHAPRQVVAASAAEGAYPRLTVGNDDLVRWAAQERELPRR